jgi:hypothetical protein
LEKMKNLEFGLTDRLGMGGDDHSLFDRSGGGPAE